MELYRAESCRGVWLRNDFPWRYLLGPICYRSNGTEANCPGPSGPGPLCMVERLNRAELSRACL